LVLFSEEEIKKLRAGDFSLLELTEEQKLYEKRLKDKDKELEQHLIGKKLNFIE
jgi:hypothetical protein